VSNQSKQPQLNRRQFVFFLQSSLLFAAFASITHCPCLLFAAVCCVLFVLFLSFSTLLARSSREPAAGRKGSLPAGGISGAGMDRQLTEAESKNGWLLYNPGRYIQYDDRNIQNFKSY